MQIIKLGDLESFDWVKKEYRTGDEKSFGYQSASGYSEEEIGIPGSIQNYVRLESGLWIPEHYHEKKDEFFVALYGKALFYLRPDGEHDKEEIPVEAGDTFRIKPGEWHSVLNPSDDYFYLYRIAFNNVPGDSILTE